MVADDSARIDVASHNVVPKIVIVTSPYSPPSQAAPSSIVLTNPVNVVCVGAGVGAGAAAQVPVLSMFPSAPT